MWWVTERRTAVQVDAGNGDVFARLAEHWLLSLASLTRGATGRGAQASLGKTKAGREEGIGRACVLSGGRFHG